MEGPVQVSLVRVQNSVFFSQTAREHSLVLHDYLQYTRNFFLSH